ncbi:SIR2 family protein [Chryseobacterium sp. 8AT]|uniref:SIR2 family protein n=1 Tax=Chryseobacterium sp. 8AT TaxID=2653134 RepID=UPI0012F39EBA|nr:SIR2 family protein [Chryseobacterium sp. 8AT]VXC43920.1 Phage protein [Chryseobacterium sp. 8AT]
MIEELKSHLQKFNTSPILFLGSGFSRRYLNLPTWENLLIEMSEQLKLQKPFEYYKSNANSQMPEIAKIMGDDFNEIWWNDPFFEESRNKFKSNATTKYSPLKFEISRRILENTEFVEDEVIEKEIRLLKKINIDGIITTNWDVLCEAIFPEFSKFIGQEELIFSELLAVGEIYKIHGCSTKPNSLVLTSDDYDNYETRNPYLAAKLLTLFIENPVIFIGYSLDDENIQSILKSIIKCLTKDKVEKLKDRLIFCQWTNEKIDFQINDSTILISDTVIPIKLIKLNSFVELYTVLANTKRKLPIKVLRQMKGMVYDFVKSNNSKQKIFVTDNLEEIENLHNAEFVYGVGLKDKFSAVGIKGVELIDVLEDIIKDNKWNSNLMSKLCLPNLNGKYIPYFKHLSIAGVLINNEIAEDIDIPEFSPEFISKVNSIKVEDFYPSKNYQKHKELINDKYQTLQELLDDNNVALHQLVYIPLLDPEKIDLAVLESYLQNNIKLLRDSKLGSFFRKLVCLYDFLKYNVN